MAYGALALPREATKVGYRNGLAEGLGSFAPTVLQCVLAALPKPSLRHWKPHRGAGTLGAALLLGLLVSLGSGHGGSAADLYNFPPRIERPAKLPPPAAARSSTRQPSVAATVVRDTRTQPKDGGSALLVLLVFFMLCAVLVFMAIREVIKWLDGLFARPTVPDPSAVPSEFRAADYRDQAEILRAVRELLDAEVEAARATIRRERARAREE